jgi:hypothetical protein
MRGIMSRQMAKPNRAVLNMIMMKYESEMTTPKLKIEDSGFQCRYFEKMALIIRA